MLMLLLGDIVIEVTAPLLLLSTRVLVVTDVGIDDECWCCDALWFGSLNWGVQKVRFIHGA